MNPLRRRGTTTATISAQRSKSGEPHEPVSPYPPHTVVDDHYRFRLAVVALCEAYTKAMTPAWIVVKDTAPIWLAVIGVLGVIVAVTGGSCS